MAVTVRTLENFVGGEWVASTGESARPVVSPVTGETLAEAPNASPEDVNRGRAGRRLRRLLLRRTGVLRDGAGPRPRKRARLLPRRDPESRGLTVVLDVGGLE